MADYVKPQFFVFLIVLIPGILGGWLAANRGRNIAGWCILCAFFPIFLMVIYFHKPLKEVEGKFKRCSSCHEFIKWREDICKYCNAAQHPIGGG
ncbi:MAG: hypothetical protein FD174_3919 [Geobacteraceae bacterium]|nr:MAG: hypothetical protein FD174_3919 [Geobacteraceae bacterium]